MLNPYVLRTKLNHFLLWGPVHTTQGEFENVGFALKTHQMFSVHTTPEEFEQEKVTIAGHFGFARELSKTPAGTYHDYCHHLIISKSSVFKMFSGLGTLKRKAGVFKFLRFEECFRKAPLWWRIWVWTEALIGEIELVFKCLRRSVDECALQRVYHPRCSKTGNTWVSGYILAFCTEEYNVYLNHWPTICEALNQYWYILMSTKH